MLKHCPLRADLHRMDSSEHGKLIPYGMAGLLVLAMLFLYMNSTSSSSSSFSSSSSRSEGSAIRAVIRQDALTDKPKNCDRLYTERLLEQIEGPVNDPLAACKRGADGHPAKAFRITRLDVYGGRATASMTIRGEPNGITSATFGLVKEPTWKIDHLTAVHVSLARMARAAQASVLKSPRYGVKAGCVAAMVRNDSQAAMDRAILSSNTKRHLNTLYLPCLNPDLLRKGFADQLRHDTIAKGVPTSIAACLSAQTAEQLTEADLRALVLGHHHFLRPLVVAATAECTASA